MKRTLTIVTVLSAAAMAMAFATATKTFNDFYKVDPGSDLGKAKCMVCHVSAKGGKLNPYGADLKVVVDKAKRKKLLVEDLKAVEKMDSNKDGVNNLDTIKKGKLPGGKG
ncbi:MAG: hypothetical protein KIT11_00945 [Fimbriimonadaceae bacterium]|nr:hypothetical protein [Fimbriimonadaceae bacterium]QYK55060.1 MAG: hypothetical protein KF733_08590 [Fimbriimonadaceae bacterium]